MNETILTAKKITKTYTEGKLKTTVLQGVDIDVKASEKVAILGSSGSGKSTLLHILGGLDKPSSGEVNFLGEVFHSLSANKRAELRNQNLGFIYQFHHLLPEFTALENVAMPLLMRKAPKKELIDWSKEMLNQVGLSHRIKHKPSELSGGERQRVAIARALINNPKCVLADEPTGNLDEENAAKVYELMCSLSDKFQTSFVIVTHNKQMAQKMDRIYTLYSGRVEV